MTFRILRIPVGADAHIGPLHQLPLTSRPAAAKREAETMRQPPRQVRHHPPRDGSCKFAENHSVPEGQAKSEQAPIRRPPSRGGPLHRSAPKRLFLFHRARRILFLGKTKRAPAAPRAVGRGGAGERAQFSPQAETELSGLCDDDNGGRIPRGNGPQAGASLPRPPDGGPHSYVRLITAPTVLPGACTTGPMRASAPTGAPFTPACRCAPPDSRW